MCPGYNTTNRFYGIHQLLIVLFMFPWIKETFSIELKSDLTNQINSNQAINNLKLNTPIINPFELALKNAQPAELQLMKIKRFYDQNRQKLNINKTLNNSFKINSNTIIITSDSRANGAKYLNETELPTNDDCLKWCLKTKQCNLAVYEEKNQGSCYLFDCGTADDFKCKFTKLNHYTSSILQVDRELLDDTNSFKQQHQHENDLVNLRSNMSINLTSNDKSQTNLTTTKQTLSKEDKPPCQENQFTCKSNLECIAIYNKCDGIKQCPDGSDEASELNCPDPSFQINQLLSINSKPTANEVSTNNKDLSDKKQSSTNQFQGLVKPNFNYKKLPEVIKLDKVPNNFAINEQKILPNANVVKPWQSILNLDSNGYPITNWNEYYANYLNGLTNMNKNSNAINQNGPNANLNSNQNNPINQANKDLSSMIWQMMDPNQQQQKAFVDALTYFQQQQLLQSLLKKQEFNNWLDSNSAASNYQKNLKSNKQDKQLSNDQSLQEQMNRLKSNSIGEQIKFNQNDQIDSNNKIDLINQLDNSKSEKLININEQKISSTTQTPINGQASNLNKDHYVSYDFKQPFIQYNGKDDFYQDINEQDSNSAVIALVLGILITIMLIVIVGFRMRSMKKRFQRKGGRSTLAHDADYLVNGMYL